MGKHKFKVGSKYRIYFGPGNWNNNTIHILAIVDKDWIVHKYWRKNKKRWGYAIENRYIFDSLIESGDMKKVK